MRAQLILTIKGEQKNDVEPPRFVGCFDNEKIAFVEYHYILPVFNLHDFNWTQTPSTVDDKTMETVLGGVPANKIVVFNFGSNDAEIKSFIGRNFTSGDSPALATPIDRNNFTFINQKWRTSVVPHIDAPWDVLKKKYALYDRDFFLAEMNVDDKDTPEVLDDGPAEDFYITFDANARGEVISLRRATENAVDSYSYDDIGNLTRFSSDATTNAYTANFLNQYTAISNLCDSAPLRLIQYDADGNLTGDGAFHYAYDAENRLRAVTSARQTNGAVRVLNAYDHRHRRTRKTIQRLSLPDAAPPAPPPLGEWATTETHTCVWDGNNIALETIAYANGTVRTCEYFWGPDLSGTEQGAGGVGGLLAVSIDGAYYIPGYDHNGNIVRYISEDGDLAAAYEYDPFGITLSATGPLVEAFTFGFSTKPLDRETGLVSYQRRFYNPALGRFLNRDPIEENGGENLYGLCKNAPILYADPVGEKPICDCISVEIRVSRRDNWKNALHANYPFVVISGGETIPYAQKKRNDWMVFGLSINSRSHCNSN